MQDIISEAIIMALLEHTDAPASLALICTSKMMQRFKKHIKHTAKFSVGYANFAAISYAGKLSAWGDNFRGPLKILDASKNEFRKISCGFSTIAAITSHGKLIITGYGECEIPNSETDLFRKVRCESDIIAAITTSNKLVLFWDTNRMKINDKYKNCDIGGYGYRKVSCSENQIAAITSSGELHVWGKNRFHQNKIPNIGNDTFCKVSCSENQIAAITSSGSLVVWGVVGFRTSLEKEKYRKVSCGNNHIAAITYSGKLVIWGECGIETCQATAISNSPHKFRKVKCVGANNASLTSSGKIITWCSKIFEVGSSGVIMPHIFFNFFCSWWNNAKRQSAKNT